MKRTILLWAVAGLLCGVVLGWPYTPQLDGTPPTAITWQQASVTYQFNDQTGPTLANMEVGSDPVTAINDGFGRYITRTGVNFVNGGTTSVTDVGSDGVNLITFANTAANNAAVGSALAVTIFSYNLGTYDMIEADIVFSSSQQWSTNGTAGLYDVGAVGTHEIGHLVGLDHTPICNATMFPYGASGDQSPQTLAEDEEAAMRALYPAAATVPSSTVTGTVQLSGGGANVFGAGVTLHDALSGRAVTGTVTLPDGTFSVAGVLPGVYHVTVEALDGPMTDANLSGGTWSSAPMETTFQSLIVGGAADPTEHYVPVGQTVSLGTITVTDGAPSRNLNGITLTSNPGGFSGLSGLPVSTQPPYTDYLVVSGPGVEVEPDANFSILGGLLTLGTSTGSGTLGGGDGYKIFPINIPADAPVGGYTIVLDSTSTGEVHFYTGGIDVATPSPAQAWVRSYGSASNGSGTAIAANGVPTLGNAGFQIDFTGGLNGSTVLWLPSFYPNWDTSFAGSEFLGVELNHLMVDYPGLPTTVSGTTTSLAVPVDASPTLAGAEVFLQAVAVDPATATGYALTNCLRAHYE